MGNHLNGFAEIVSSAFLGEDGFVDTAGGPVIVAREFDMRKALIVAEVEIGFGAVIGDEDFAVLKRAHRTGIDVQVRIAFLNGDFEAATFEETTDRGCCNALAE